MKKQQLLKQININKNTNIPSNGTQCLTFDKYLMVKEGDYFTIDNQPGKSHCKQPFVVHVSSIDYYILLPVE